MDKIDIRMKTINRYNFGFENLAFEGGGVKMVGYIGVIKVLEDIGMMKNIKRFAGTSGGAIVAMLASVGCTSDEMRKHMSVDFKSLMFDSYKLSFLYNLLNKFGWNCGDAFLDYMEKILEEKTGKKQITFKQIYDMYDKELCVLATDVSTLSLKYFHPKTTPDIAVSLAVKCSAALPGLMQPPTISFDGTCHYFTDGGITCNYPLYVYDGWYLSMKAKNSFFNQLRQYDHPFGMDINAKTLGCIVTSVGDKEVYQAQLLKRETKHPIRPDTKLAQKKWVKWEKECQQITKGQKLREAGERFLDCLQKVDRFENGCFPMQEFRDAVEQLTEDDFCILFPEKTHEDVFKEIKTTVSGKKQMICDVDFLRFRNGFVGDFLAMLEGGVICEINSFGSYIGNVNGLIHNLSQRASKKPEDLFRTIGINTAYVSTADFELEEGDKEFLIQQGENACVDYMSMMVDLKRRGELPKEFVAHITLKNPVQSDDEIDGLTKNDYKHEEVLPEELEERLFLENEHEEELPKEFADLISPKNEHEHEAAQAAID